jgi:hypothetical protein
MMQIAGEKRQWNNGIVVGKVMTAGRWQARVHQGGHFLVGLGAIRHQQKQMQAAPLVCYSAFVPGRSRNP